MNLDPRTERQADLCSAITRLADERGYVARFDLRALYESHRGLNDNSLPIKRSERERHGTDPHDHHDRLASRQHTNTINYWTGRRFSGLRAPRTSGSTNGKRSSKQLGEDLVRLERDGGIERTGDRIRVVDWSVIASSITKATES